MTNYSTFICPFESKKCGKDLNSVERKGKNYKNLNISGMKRAFQMGSKAFLTVFERLSFAEKIQNSRHKL